MDSVLPMTTRRDFLTSAVAAGGFSLLNIHEASPETQVLAACGPQVPEVANIPVQYINNPGLLALRANVLIRQLKLGYNYYGQPRNWIPPVSLSEFNNRLTAILSNLNAVDQYLSGVNCDLKDQKAANDQLVATQSNIKTISDQAAIDIDSTNDYIIQILGVIANLTSDITAQYSVVLADQDQFNSEVQANATGGCSWQQTFEIVVAIVAVVAAVYTAGASLVALASSTALAAGSAAAAVGAGVTSIDNLKKAYASFQVIERNIQTAKAEIDDIVTKYKTLKRDFDMSVNQDASRIVLNESDYDAITKQKLEQLDNALSSANASGDTKERFKAAVHRYVELVQLRNKKIYDHDSMVLTLQALSQRIVELETQKSQIDSVQAIYLQSNQLPDKISYFALMKNAHDSQIEFVKNLVWSEGAALKFSTMDPSFSLPGAASKLFSYTPSVANLILVHNQTQANILNWEIARGPGTTFGTHSIQRRLNSAGLAQLARSRRVNISVTQQDFTPSMRQVIVTDFRVSCTPTVQSLSGVFSHMGDQKFLSQAGKQIQFTGKIFPFAFNLADEHTGGDFHDVTGKGVYVGFSALGSWLVEIDQSVPIKIIREIRTVTLTFKIAYRAPT